MNKTEVLKTYFGYDSFRKGQENVIDGLLAGKDVVAIMPTGAGKSLCYQVPALLFSGITLVISPLISLMQDQVKSLNEAGVHAAYINSSLTETQISKALALAARGTYQIIYVAPERLESAAFMHFVSQVKISMVTVDEAHCISQWGQDFRPGYLKIVEFIESLPERPVVSAFTATATEEVKEDIACILKLKNPEIIVTGFDRENLYYSVEHIAGKRKDVFVMDYLKKHPRESGIIYCATRKNVDALYEILCKQGIAAARYHAGMDNGERKKSQENFIYDRAPVIVATNAFGMGIDKSNVRFVIHYNMPQSMENYYQEAGRAGRDGSPARCVLLYAPGDVRTAKFLIANSQEAQEGDPDRLRRDRWRGPSPAEDKALLPADGQLGHPDNHRGLRRRQDCRGPGGQLFPLDRSQQEQGRHDQPYPVPPPGAVAPVQGRLQRRQDQGRRPHHRAPFYGIQQQFHVYFPSNSSRYRRRSSRSFSPMARPS